MFGMDAAYREYAVMVYKFLLSLCYEEELAEELTQETFYQAVRSVDRYDGSCKVSTWLCQIAKHLWYREIERRKDELKKDVKPLKKLKRVTRQMIAGTVLFCIVVIGITLGAYETYYGEVVQPDSEDVKITCEKIDPFVRIGFELQEEGVYLEAMVNEENEKTHICLVERRIRPFEKEERITNNAYYEYIYVSADHGIKEASDKETVEVEFKDTTKTVKITDLYTEKEIQNLK